MCHFESRLERLRRLGDESLKGVFVPRDVAFRRRLLPHHFLPGRDALSNAKVFDHVLGCLNHHRASLVEPFSARSSGDLLKVAHAQDTNLFAIEFAELGEEDGSNRDVDADSERVRSTDDLEQSRLRQLLHPQAIPWQEARVVQTQSVAQELLKFLSVR